MASGGGGSSSAPPSGKQLPRDVIVMHAMLKEMGVTAFEPRLLNQMLDFIYKYVTSVVEEARVYSAYAKKKTIDVDDIRLAVKVITDKSYSTVPPRDMLLEIAKNRNTTPLPLLKASSGLRLPPDRFCLTQPNYQLQFNKRAVASSALMSGSRSSYGSAGPSSVFKTPTGLPLRTVVLTNNASSASSNEPDFKKQKFSQ